MPFGWGRLLYLKKKKTKKNSEDFARDLQFPKQFSIPVDWLGVVPKLADCETGCFRFQMYKIHLGSFSKVAILL